MLTASGAAGSRPGRPIRSARAIVSHAACRAGRRGGQSRCRLRSMRPWGPRWWRNSKRELAEQGRLPARAEGGQRELIWDSSFRLSDAALWTILCASISNASCAILGCYLLLRRMSLLGDAISHSILLGIAGAFLRDWAAFRSCRCSSAR